MAVGITFAITLTACVGPSEPEPTPTPLIQYDPQPDFATVLDPTATVPTDTATTARFAADYADKGAPFDRAQIMNASQGGYAPMNNPRWFTDKLPHFSQMGLQQIRLDHILNDYLYGVVVEQADGSITYDFSRLDQTVVPLLDQGFQPLIALSYTPTAFAKSPWSPPPLQEWTAAVAAVVSHYKELGFTGWDWEVWNEPDGSHWTGTFDEYNALYAATASTVKSVDPTARVGGAAAAYLTSAGNVSGQFINYIAANPTVPIDFFSVHNYSTNNWSTVEAAAKMLAEAGRPDLPILITEWGNHPRMEDGPGGGSDTNASSTGASYIARQLYLAGQSSAEKVFYFTPAEGLRFATPYNGDLGLITVDGHRKSSGNVFEMYSRLGDIRVELDATGAGTDTQDVYGFLSKSTASTDATLLLWNTTPTDVRTTLDLENLPYEKGNVRIVQRAISAQQGNGYADDSTSITSSYPSANENAPVVADTVVKASSTYTDKITLPANGVVEITFSATDREAGAQLGESEPSATNLAATASGGFASASSSREEPTNGWGVLTALDGRRYTVDIANGGVRGWSSQTHQTATATESITVDLGAVVPVDSVSLWPYTTRGSASSGFPVDAQIRGSVDGTEWLPLADLNGYGAAAPVSGEQTFSFEVAAVRFITVEATTLGAVTGSDGRFAFQLTEIEAYRTGVFNGGFETGDLTGWDSEGTTEAQSTVFRRGNHAAQVVGGASISTEIRGLRPDTTYTVGAYIRANGADARATLTVGLPRSGAVATSTSSARWEHKWVTFTTADDETSAVITLANADDADPAWFDDVTVMQLAAG